MTHLTLVRHGQTDWNLQDRWQGHIDIPLNQTGITQAQILAEKLTHAHFEAVYSSDLARAHATAAAIAAQHSLPVHLDARLREIRLGEWEGKLYADLPTLYPQAWAEREHDIEHAQPPGNGESVGMLTERMVSALDDICSHHHPTAHLLIVTHGMSLAVLRCHLEQLPLNQVIHLVPENSTPIQVEWKINRATPHHP